MSGRRDQPDTRVRGAARFDELVGVIAALEERDRLGERERRRLDRRIGAASSDWSSLSQLRHWLAEAPSQPLRERLARVRSGLAGAEALLAGLGLFVGWAAAAAVLSVEVHAGRINIVLAWGLLAAAPFALWLLGFGAFWLGKGFGRGDSGSLGDIIGRFSFSRLLLRALPASIRSDVELVMGRLTANRRLYSRVQRAQLLRWSQVFGLAFALGALAGTLAFVVFTDLAFGWSTTLEASAEGVHAAASAVAKPWALVWEEATPSLELVESTRYFRAGRDDHGDLIDPIVYGGWWPFLVMSIGVYAVLPRGLGLLAAVWIQRRETGRAIGLTPGVDRLIDRLSTPLIEGQAAEAETDVGRPAAELVAEVAVSEWLSSQRGRTERCALICWAEALDAAQLQAALGEAASDLLMLEAGGRSSLDADAEVIEQAMRAKASVLFVARGYEPPVLDVLDFLAAWRRRAGPESGLCVALVGADARGRETWRRRLISLGDPGIVVAAWPGAEGPRDV